MNGDKETISILFTGDLHIGRTSRLLRHGLPGGTGSTTDAWHRTVDLALSRNVDLVLVCGDLVDADTGFHEALEPVIQGIARLEQRGITTLAIAGNHDYSLLPRLVDRVNSPGLHLLGRDGTWQRYLHHQDGQCMLAVDGWSFPRAHVRQDPVCMYQPQDPGVPVLAMAHGLLDVPDTVQAPLDRRLMQNLPLHGWILGHYHSPPGERQDPGAPLILYIGSAQALGPSERGFHGPWLARAGRKGVEHLQQLSVSDVRYETICIDISGLDTEDRVESAVLSRVYALAREVAAESGDVLRYLSLRLELTGSALPEARLADTASGLKNMQLQTGHCQVGIDEIRYEKLPCFA